MLCAICFTSFHNKMCEGYMRIPSRFDAWSTTLIWKAV